MLAVQERYRFGRLWIIGPHYEADGEQIRFAKLANMDDLPDEADGDIVGRGARRHGDGDLHSDGFPVPPQMGSA